jgi:hypothetical protein
MPQRPASDCPAEYSDLLRVLRQELRVHYKLPKDLPHQILTIMMALNDPWESAPRTTAPAPVRSAKNRLRAR